MLKILFVSFFLVVVCFVWGVVIYKKICVDKSRSWGCGEDKYWGV